MNEQLFKRLLRLVLPVCFLLPSVCHAQWVDFARLSTNRFGACSSPIDLRALLRPHVEDGTEHRGGEWSVDGTPLSGDIWTVPSGLRNAQCYEVSYAWQVTADSAETNRILLCVDPLPTLEVTLPPFICSDTVPELQLQLTGGAPFILSYELRHYVAGDAPVALPQTRVIASGAYREKIGRLPGEDSIAYHFTALTDAHGCPSSSDKLGVYSQSFVLRQQFRLLTRHPHAEGVPWTETLAYSIGSSDSIGVQIVPQPGFPVSDYKVLIDEKALTSGGSPFTLRGSGTHHIAVSGGECPSEQEFNVHMNEIFTRYLRLNVLLEGPYDPLLGQMRTGAITLPDYRGVLPPGAVDWLVVEGRMAPNAEQAAGGGDSCRVVSVDTCIVLSDGCVIDRKGSYAIGLRVDVGSPFYLVVRHRNHLALMSTALSALSETPAEAPLVNLMDVRNLYCPAEALGYAVLPASDGAYLAAMSVGYFDRSLVSVSSTNEVAEDGMSARETYSLYDVNMDGRVDWQEEGTDWGLVSAARDRHTPVREKVEEPLPEFLPDAGAISVPKTIWCRSERFMVQNDKDARMDAPVVYSWYKNGALLPGQHGAALSLGDMLVGTYSFFRRASSVDGRVWLDTETLSVSVADAPAISEITSPGALCAGDEINLTPPVVDASGSVVTAQGWVLGSSSIEMPYTVEYSDSSKRLRYWAENGCSVK